MSVYKWIFIVVGLWSIVFSMEKVEYQEQPNFFNREMATPEERALFDKFVALRRARLRGEPGVAGEAKETSSKEQHPSTFEEVGSYAQSAAHGLYGTAKAMMNVGKVALWCIKGVGFAAEVVDKVCTGAQHVYSVTTDYLAPVQHSSLSEGELQMTPQPVNEGAVSRGYSCPTNINLSPSICMLGLSASAQPEVIAQLMGACAGGNPFQLEQLVRMNQLFGSFQAAYEKNVYAEHFCDGGRQHSVYKESIRSVIRK